MTGLTVPDVAVASVLRRSPWRYLSVGEVHEQVGAGRLHRRAVRRSLGRLADAGLIELEDRLLGGWRWAVGADDVPLVEVAERAGVELPPVADRPDVCPDCGARLDPDWRAADGAYGCRVCHRLV